MNFLEHKESLKTTLENALHVNKDRVKKTVALCNYLDSEFYDESYEEEIQVTSHIEKQIGVIAKKMLLSLTETLPSESLHVDYEIPKIFEAYEGIFYLWGTTVEDNQPVKKPAFNRYQKPLSNSESFMVMVDLHKGIEIIPWNQ